LLSLDPQWKLHTRSVYYIVVTDDKGIFNPYPQISLIRSQLTAQYVRQDNRMQEVKTLLRDTFKEKLAQTLRPRVHLLIQAKVEERMKEKVHEQVSHTRICLRRRTHITLGLESIAQ